jgi:hypothetical protein
MRSPGLWLGGGIAGMASIVAYLLAIAVPWPETQLGTSAGLLVAAAFPILGIVYSYALCSFVAAERDGAANRLGLLFAVAGFSTLLAMLVVQLAVGSGIGEITRELDAGTARALRRGLRLIDLGLDVAWDLLMSTGLVFWGMAIRKRSGLGPGWGIPLVALGLGLIGLNAATFPWPPGDHGLVDLGPVTGLFMLALAARLALLGRRASAEAPATA